MKLNQSVIETLYGIRNIDYTLVSHDSWNTSKELELALEGISFPNCISYVKRTRQFIAFALIVITSLGSFSLSGQSDQTIDFKWSNDIVGSTDYYFTNGFELNYTFEKHLSKPVSTLFIKASDYDRQALNIGLHHDMYTPKDLHTEDPVYTDRPYAATLLLSFTSITSNPENGLIVTSSIQSGVMGPFAGGARFQNGFHGLTDKSDNVYGWENQISNSFCFMYQTQFDQKFFMNEIVDVAGHTIFSLGVPFTKAGIGMDFRLGNPGDRYSNLVQTDGKMRWYFYGGVDFDFVLYDGTLQGDLFNTQSIHTIEEIEPVIGKVKYGVSFRYNIFQADVGMHYNTAKFNGANTHAWGFAAARGRTLVMCEL